MSDSPKVPFQAQVSKRRRCAAEDLLEVLEDYLGGMEWITRVRKMTEEEKADFQWLMKLALSLKPYVRR